MNRLVFSTDASPDTALLIKNNFVDKSKISLLGAEYFVPISAKVGDKINKRVVALGTYHPRNGKVKKADIKIATSEILEYCDTVGIELLVIADGEYFKYISGCKSVEKHIGEVTQCAVPDYEHIKVTPLLNHTAISMFPEKRITQDKGFQAVADAMSGTYKDKQEFTFTDYKVIKDFDISELHQYPELSIDIEATGLKVETNELISISFSYNETSAIVVPIHRRLIGEDAERKTKEMLKTFFMEYDGKKIYHNALFDVKFLVWHLFMSSADDYVGRTNGTNVLDGDDTMIMAFCSLNSTSRISLSLKDLAYDYIGEYAVGVKNILEDLDNGILTEDELYEYNGKDTAATFHLYNKFNKMLDEEEQRYTYETIMQPALNYLVQMMLNGLPLDKNRVSEVKEEITKTYQDALIKLRCNSYVKLCVRQMREDAADKYNSTHKVARRSAGDFMDMVFNPNSNKQLALLLFDVMGYEPIELTPAGAPKSSRAIIEELLSGETEFEKREVLEALIAISQTAIILSTFLESFESYWYDTGDGTLGRLYGNQRLGGTVSGRLSSNNP